MTSFLAKKEKYFSKYFYNRILKILIPFIIAIVAYQILTRLDGNVYKWHEILSDLTKDGMTEKLLPSSWYVFVILFLYASFYLVFKFFTKNISRAILYSFLFSLIAIVILKYYLKFGDWWSLSILSFPLGVLWKYKEKVIFKFLQNKRHCSYIIIVFSLAAVSLHFSSSILNKLFSFSNNSLSIYLSILAYALLTVSAVVVLYNFKLPSSSFLRYLGDISYEIYLLQGIPIFLLKGNHIFVQSHVLYVIFTLLCVIILATVFHKFSSALYNKIGIFCHCKLK
jgi:peptidoglycan/LPS O-acetylase OafA/YrhL